MSGRFVLALDQGTTSSRAIVFDHGGQPVAVAQQEYPQDYPFPGHVTHDPEDIWQSQLAVTRQAVAQVPGGIASIAPRVATIMAADLGWDQARQAAEVDAYLTTVQREYDVPSAEREAEPGART